MKFLTKERLKNAIVEIISMIATVIIALADNSWCLDNLLENQS